MNAFATPTVRLSRGQWLTMVGHCYQGVPDEACGMLLGRLVPGTARADGKIERVHPCRNADGSARTYTVEPRDLLRAMRAADEAGLDLVGVYHSHTHTDAYPSPTDVRAAVDPGWLYLIVSLRAGDPTVRAYRIVDGNIGEVPVVLEN